MQIQYELVLRFSEVKALLIRAGLDVLGQVFGSTQKVFHRICC
jgi:hypothetical protein